jgi:ABC-type transport system involved in multi-copper enzyme maturation permease subunit
MWKFIHHELKYWLKTPMLWIFLFIVTLMVFLATSSDNVQIGGKLGNTFKNAPFIIERYYSILSIMCFLMTTAFMSATANRDFQSGMHQFVFSSPIKKSHYFFGKFIGATIISIIPMLGVSFGILLAPILAPLFEMCPAERYGEVYITGHLLGIVVFAIPNIIISGVLLFGLAIIFRSNIVSFIGAMLILIFYVFSIGLIKDSQNEWLANIIDPFGIRPFEGITKYLTIDEKNFGLITLHGDLLTNRLLWLGISFFILTAIYFKFSFNTGKEKAKKTKKTKSIPEPKIISGLTFQPTKANVFSLSTFWNLVKFETKAIIKNPSFIIITSIGLINFIAGIASFTGRFGSSKYPVTYYIVDQVRDGFSIFMIGFITFYTGVLVWSARDAKINEIQDATAIKTEMLFLSKLASIIISLIIVLTATILVGIIVQTANGYYRFELDVYIKSLLGLELLYLSFLAVLSMLFHYLINNRYISYFAFVIFITVNAFIWGFFEIDSNMLKFGKTPSFIYSDMNGFGPYAPTIIWFNIYWILFCVVLSFVIMAFYSRGKELQFNHRWTNAKLQFRKNKIALTISVIAFLLCSSFVYYNTQILNTYDSAKEIENKQVAYEKAYKKYENLVQPRFFKFNTIIDIMPEKRSMTMNIQAWAKNISASTIKEIHFSLPGLSDSTTITMSGAKLKLNDKQLNYRIYTLVKNLAPNDSIQINFDINCSTKGFENEVSKTQLTQNGTFFRLDEVLPTIGYNDRNELADKNKRLKLKLPKRDRMPKLDNNNIAGRSNNYISKDADWVELTTTMSTSVDQTAIAPGSLIKTWQANGRKYFLYKLDKKSLNFFSFISAKYEIARKKWNGIDIEVYYDKQHSANVPNMLKSLQKSLEYYTANFGPYYHKQCRIIEFPRYKGFAQAFPGTMPYSEGIGFILDLRKVTKEDIDVVYKVVAHEMGHQYWGDQVTGANMQGSEMMSESFAQYSSMMVMEKEYGKDKMKKFLNYEMNDYLRGRSEELQEEQPLMKTEDQSYIHYNKGSVAMYYLKEMIGEKKVNQAMQNLITAYGYKNPPYATSIAAVNEFRKATPDSLKYIIKDLFETITLFNNRMLEAKYKKIGSEYEITLKTTSEKFRSDALGKETLIPIADYIDIGVFAEPKNDNDLGKVLIYKRFKVNKKDNTYVFRTKELPFEAGIDPYNYLIDRVPEDNLKSVEDY